MPGCGSWRADQLERYRKAVADDGTGEDLVGIVDGMRAAKVDVTGHHALKTAPKGYPRDHPRIDLLRNKGLIAWKDWPAGAWLGKTHGQGPGRRVPPHLPAALRVVGHQRRRLDAPA